MSTSRDLTRLRMEKKRQAKQAKEKAKEVKRASKERASKEAPGSPGRVGSKDAASYYTDSPAGSKAGSKEVTASRSKEVSVSPSRGGSPPRTPAVPDDLKVTEEELAAIAAGTETEVESTTDEEQVNAAEEALARREHMFGVWWCCIKFMRPIYRIRRKHKRADIIRSFFKAVEDEGRIKNAVMRLMALLKTHLVGRAWHYLQNKRKRVAEMAAMWCRVEDKLLSTHFNRMKRAILKDA